jgi:hypothetical protein
MDQRWPSLAVLFGLAVECDDACLISDYLVPNKVQNHAVFDYLVPNKNVAV